MNITQQNCQLDVSTKTILVIDDDVSVLESLDFILTGTGYNIFLAPDGESALDILKTKWIDGVILDLRMPKISGYFLASVIKKESMNSNTNILILSGEALMIADFKITVPNIIGKMSKPFETAELQAAVKQLVA